jgi:molybdopterin-guanine dinucleotide biosynthesis protein B
VIPILSVVGRSESGKTTLLEKLIRELAGRGRRVGTIKHHYHGPVTVDVAGKDSWRHRQAGAHAVALVSPDTVFVVRDAPAALSLETLTHLAFCGVDLVLTEGFKSGPMPKIEVNRQDQQAPLLCGPADRLAAVVSDWDTGAPVPHFGLEDVVRLADFVERHYLRPPEGAGLEVLVGGRRQPLDPRVEAVVVRVVRSLLGGGGDPAAGPPIELRIPGQTP